MTSPLPDLPMLRAAMEDAELAIRVVGTGAEVVRRLYGTSLDRIDKGAGDFATTADLESEAAMVALLGRERQDDAVLGEESGRGGARDSTRLWLLDPLCGTLNYAARMPVVAVNAALTSGGEVLAAAAAEPFGDEVFWTDGRSAFVRSQGRDAPLAPNASSGLVDLNLDPPFPSAPAFHAAALAADPEFAASFMPRVVASSLALTWVATGQRCAYITDGDVRDSVHFAAGLGICTAAGCSVSDLRGGPWGQGSDGLIVAADQSTHAELLAMVKRQLGPAPGSARRGLSP